MTEKDSSKAEPESKSTRKSKTTLLNPGTTAVTYSTDGRSLGAGERVEVDKVDEVAKVAIESGYLVRK